MNTHSVTYDLTQPGRDYDKLIGAIKRYPAWCPVTKSEWLIRTTETTSQVRDALARVMDANDKLFVVNVTGKDAAWRGLSTQVSEWIKKNL
jgi:hypothetical protein